MSKPSILKYYLSDLGSGFEIEIRVTSSENFETNKGRYGYKVFADLEQDKDKILEYAHANNIDLIFTDDSELIIELYKTGKPFQYAETTLQLENEIQAYVSGKGVPWDFSQPVWNATWFAKHIENAPLLGN